MRSGSSPHGGRNFLMNFQPVYGTGANPAWGATIGSEIRLRMPAITAGRIVVLTTRYHHSGWMTVHLCFVILEQRSEQRNWHYEGITSDSYFKRYAPACIISTDRLDTATCTHTLLSTDVHIRTYHVRYTLRSLHCFSVVSCPHPSDSALNGILTCIEETRESCTKLDCSHINGKKKCVEHLTWK
ncbi:hypothetical protein ANN_12580 [Periplaneta americana]|uniref:Uncharacterized protein n=1 Tax=Periplaneta americana TaxID=6978 RepID=A0ABQ8TJ47_PERAM|nr:hypothetical protein ANN_12580 [Periplaneta americana]